MANYQPNEDYTGETKLRKWWPVVKANFADVYSKLNGHFNGTADRHKGADVDYNTQMTVTAAIDKEISDRKSADTTEQNARIAADNAEREARMGADNAEQTARQEADTEIKNEMNNVFTESGIVEEVTETATLWISHTMEIGINLTPATETLSVAGPVFSGANGDFKINNTDVDISNVTMTPTETFETEEDYGQIYMTVYGKITEGNQYAVTEAAASFEDGDGTLIDYENGIFSVRLCVMLKQGTSNLVTEIYNRETENEVESKRIVINSIGGSDEELAGEVEEIKANMDSISPAESYQEYENQLTGYSVGTTVSTRHGFAKEYRAEKLQNLGRVDIYVPLFAEKEGQENAVRLFVAESFSGSALSYIYQETFNVSEKGMYSLLLPGTASIPAEGNILIGFEADGGLFTNVTCAIEGQQADEYLASAKLFYKGSSGSWYDNGASTNVVWTNLYYKDTAFPSAEINRGIKLSSSERDKRLRACFVSDTHWNAEPSWTRGTANERMQIMVDAINAENLKKPIDFVVFNGDMITLTSDSLGTKKEDMREYIDTYLSQLNMPWFALRGNHDGYSDSDWEELFGNKPQFSIETEDYVFLCIDVYSDYENGSLYGGTDLAYIGADRQMEWIEKQLAYAKAAEKKVIAVYHTIDTTADVNWFNLYKTEDIIIGQIKGHSHVVFANTENGKANIGTGSFGSKPLSSGGGDNNDTANAFGFKILEMQPDKLVAYHVYPEMDYPDWGCAPYHQDELVSEEYVVESVNKNGGGDYSFPAMAHTLIGKIRSYLAEKIQAVQTSLLSVKNNTEVIKNANGGFSAGDTSDTAAYGGAAAGHGTSTVDGASVGYNAVSADGCSAGCNSSTQNGGASGKDASSNEGGAAGSGAGTKDGGAVGESAISGDGFSGGKGAAAAEDPAGGYIDAVQLGTGTNSKPKTLQVYDYTLMNSDGTIPPERLSNARTSQYATIVVGTTASGHTKKQVDFLCDGTDDQIIINQAIQTLAPSGSREYAGGKILLLAGHYQITGSIDVNTPQVTLEGDGNGTVIYSSGQIFGAIKVASAQCSIKSIGLVQSDGEKSSVGIYLNGESCKDCLVENCRITGYGYGLNATNASNIVVKGVTAAMNTNGIHINSNNCRVHDNYCYDNEEAGISIEGSRNLITGNTAMRGAGETTDYSESQHTIRMSFSPSKNLITNNLILGKDVTQAGSGNTVTNNKHE